MENNQGNQTPSENSSLEKNQSDQENSTNKNSNGQTENAGGDLDVTDDFKKVFKLLDQVKENTGSERNVKALERVESVLDKVAGILEHIPSLPGTQEHNKPPETPNVDVPGFQIQYIRKRGGRIVKRSIPIKNSERAETQ